MVNVTVSPTLGVALLTDFDRDRSDCCGVSVALAVLLPVLGSNWSLWLTAAVFVFPSGLTTLARICRVCGTAAVTVPTVHTPVLETYVPWLGVALTNVNPAGNR